MGPLDSTVSLNPIDSCMPFYPTGSRPRARQVIEKIKRQASALVRSPSRRARPHSCTSPLRVPTVTFVAASPVESSFSGRASSVPDSHHDNAILHIDAPPASDVIPYPIVSRLEYQTASPSAQASILTPFPLCLGTLRFNIIHPLACHSCIFGPSCRPPLCVPSCHVKKMVRRKPRTGSEQ